MDAGYVVQVADGVLRVVFRGRQDFETTENAIAEGARLLRDKNLGSVLFDFDAADASGYFAETVRHAEGAEKLGLAHELRLAFCSARDLEAMEFMATVAANRGYRARAFRREKDALRWLKAACALEQVTRATGKFSS